MMGERWRWKDRQREVEKVKDRDRDKGGQIDIYREMDREGEKE